jgi:putative pyruvate formate lyase activating enzyme
MKIENALERYYKILSGEEKAKFLLAKGKLLDEKIKEAYEILKNCELCERKCRINREKEKGECKVGDKPIISSTFIHIGEEYFFVPSFTIFFMGCNFHCQFCQNYTISQWYEIGMTTIPKQIADIINEIKNCKNVNFVGGEPTPNLPFILEALKYVEVNIPVIWNSNFYMSKKSMNLLSNVVDVYLSDWKYGNDKCALRLSKVPNYWEIIKRNHDLAFNDSEMVIRHLLLPNHFECCTRPIFNYVAKNYKDKVIVNIMDQYYPHFNATKYEEINRRITEKEFEKAIKHKIKELKVEMPKDGHFLTPFQPAEVIRCVNLIKKIILLDIAGNALSGEEKKIIEAGLS